MSRLSLHHLLGMVLLICSLFPWTSPVPITSDTQPLALAIGLLYALLFLRSIPVSYWPFVIACAVAWLIYISDPGMSSLRGFVGYLSLLIIPLALRKYFITYGPPGFKFLISIMVIWGIIGVIQFWVPEIVSFLSSREGIFGLTGGRGSMSFAPEPTFYGLWLLLFSLSILMISSLPGRLSKKQVTILLSFALIQLILVSRSTLVLVILTMSAVAYLVIYFRIFLVAFLILIGIGGLGLYYISGSDIDSEKLAENFRLLRLLISVLNVVDINNILAIDGSISDRFVQIFASHYFFIVDYMFPHGFYSWSEASSSLPPMLKGAYHSMDGLDRVLSFTGSALYEIGIFAVPLLLSIFFVVIRALPGSGFRATIYKGFVLIILFVQAFPLALPTVSYLIAVSLYVYRAKRLEKLTS